MTAKRLKLKVSLSLMVLGILSLMFALTTAISFADTPSVKIWEYGEEEHRINKIIGVGGSTGAIIGYKLDSISEQSHTWSIDDTSICQLEEASDGKISLIGIGEGLTRLRLSVKASDNKTYTDCTVISVYTMVESANGVTNKVTTATRSAHSGEENSNERASLPKGTKLSVYGKCGSYYRATVDYEFTDGRKTKNAFIAITDIDIPVTGIKLDATALRMQPGEMTQLNATVEPALATDKTVVWESSKTKVATVNKSGNITAKKSGKTTITVKSSDGKNKTNCNVTVSVDTPEAAAPVIKTKRPNMTGKANSLTSVELKVVNGSKTSSNYYVSMDGKKISPTLYPITVGEKKLNNNRFKMKKGKTYKIKIGGLRKNTKYKFAVQVGNHKSNKVKITTGVPELTVTQNGKNLVVKWNKIKDSKGYYIYKGTTAKKAQESKKPYKKIKSEKTLEFIDKKCERGVEYYYVVRAKKGTKKTPAESGMIIDSSFNMEYAQNSKLFEKVKLDSSPNWDANGYTLPNGSYPPIKYRFTGTVLQIHLYIDFVQYNMEDGNLTFKVDPKETLEDKLCSDLFVEGLKEGFDGIRVASGKEAFGEKGFAFDTELIIHKARNGENYNSAQRFIQVRIGGLALKEETATKSYTFHDYDGDLWFHAWQYKTPADVLWLPYIHMPTNAQLKRNTGYYAGTKKDAFGYKGTAAHEMGHILGLYDAYSKTRDDGSTVDRCAENSETCYKEKESDQYSYYSVMKGGHQFKNVKMRANDIEMMLYAYSLTDNGIPQNAFQNYNSFNDGINREISEMIMNKNDELIEK